MEEDIKNMSKEELLDYLEEISQQLDNIALDQIKIAIAELQYFKDQYKQLEEENKRIKSFDIYKLVEDWETGQLIPVSKVKEKMKEIKSKGICKNTDFCNNSCFYYSTCNVLQDLLERSREDGR